MTITYVTDGPWGSGTDTPHTAAEADAIIWDLVEQIAAVSGAGPVEIDHVTQTGTTFSFVMSDASVLGPITMPRPVQRPTVTTTVAGTTLTPAANQASAYFRCTNGAGCEITIEDDDDIPVDTEWHFRQCDGDLFFVEGGSTDASVTLNPVEDKLFATGKIGAVVTVKKVAAGSFDIFGALADDVTA